MLGSTTRRQGGRAARLERVQRLEAQYAQEVLDVTGIADLGLVDAETLAAWNRDNGPSLSTAERAAADRSWAYGHVIIDEAQELSAMAWRMVLRRNPSRSMTVVGDVAQTGSPAGATSWKEMLTPLVGTRWREERLTVNYRTPAEIMTVAADVLAAVAPAERPPDSVRSEGVRRTRSKSRPTRTSRRPSPGSPARTWPSWAAPTAAAWRSSPPTPASPNSRRPSPRRSPATAPSPSTRRPPCSRSRRPRAWSSTASSSPTRPASSPNPPTAATTST